MSPPTVPARPASTISGTRTATPWCCASRKTSCPDRLITAPVLNVKTPGGNAGGSSLGRKEMPKHRPASKTERQELMANRLQFAAKIRAARAVLAWSQTEVAKRAGLTQRAIYQIEQALVDARMSTTTAISAAFTKAGIRFEDAA